MMSFFFVTRPYSTVLLESAEIALHFVAAAYTTKARAIAADYRHALAFSNPRTR